MKKYSPQWLKNTHHNDQEISTKMTRNTHHNNLDMFTTIILGNSQQVKNTQQLQEILTIIIKKYSPQWWGFQQDCHEHLGSRRDVFALSEKYWDWRFAEDWSNTSLQYWIQYICESLFAGVSYFFQSEKEEGSKRKYQHDLSMTTIHWNVT